MKKLNYLGNIALFLASFITVTSCQNHNDIIDDVVREQISLIPEVTTRGATVTSANMSEFAAFGYAHGKSDWADVSTTATSSLMFNNKYTKMGNSWVGAINTPWPDNEFKRYSFFAYSPAGSVANKITVLTNNLTKGYQRLSYETLTDVNKQVDLVLASRLNQTPANEVPLSFGHVLSRVGFCAYAEKTGVTVKSISINGVKYQGQIEVRRDADWSNISANKANFTANINSGEISTDVNNPTMLTGSSGENYFMLLPQDLTGNTDNTTRITVVTTKEGRDRSLSYTITHNYQKGKSLLYKLLIPDGVDLVVDYSVTDWTTNNIPTDIKATYLNINSLSEIAPVTFFYATDFAGAVTATEVGTPGKLSIIQDVAKKSFSVTGIIGGNHRVQVTAGNLSKTVDITVPISVTPSSQSNIPYNGASYNVKVNSLYAWSAIGNWSNVTITPSSGQAGTDIPVVITVNGNVNRYLSSVPVTFIAVNGAITSKFIWAGSQIANPDYYVGRFAGTIVTKTIDANTTRCYFSKQLFTSAADLGSTMWGKVNSSTGAESLIDGKSNTDKLYSGNYPAASACIGQPGGNWYLPAQNQLLALWIGKFALSSLSGSFYWSSTENSNDSGRSVNMNDGKLYFSPKTNSYFIRCVREL